MSISLTMESSNDTEQPQTQHKKESSEPSRLTDGMYAVFQETSAKYEETWMYFLRVDGNEKQLAELDKQLDQIKNMRLYDDLNAFDLEKERYVSAQTAKEMSLLDLNYKNPHRKFDGKMTSIKFGFKSGDSDKKRIRKVNELLKNGRIANFIDDEDIEPEDLLSHSESMSESESETDDESDSDTDTDTEESDHAPRKDDKRRGGKLPSSLRNNTIPKPRFATKAQRHRA